MTVEELNDHFALPGVLHFTQDHGLTRAEVRTPTATAIIYLQGAHITHWQPNGTGPVLFLSDRSEFARGKPIRGGVPVIFPWFGPDTVNRDRGKPGPSHGFARLEEWAVHSAGLEGDQLSLTLGLGPTDRSRSFGFDSFHLTFQITVGRELSMQLTVANSGGSALAFEEALHTYFAVADARRTSIAGLEGVRFLDKTDKMQQKSESNTLQLSRWTDRVYLDTSATCNVLDRANDRKITVTKHDSLTTVVWNPWDEIARSLPDLGAEEWPRFVCVETANAARNAIILAPGESHTMRSAIAVNLQ